MRQTSVVLAALALPIAWWLQPQRPATAANSTSANSTSANSTAAKTSAKRPSFEGREIRTVTESTAAEVDPAIKTAFSKIVSERSLLIHDCGAWCGGPEFRLDSVLERATGTNPTSFQAPFTNWFESLAPAQHDLQREMKTRWPDSGPATFPVHLLAVVNRLDFAKFDAATGRWSGAELRFVYGANFQDPAIADIRPARMTLIVELVLAPLSTAGFKKLAQGWIALSAAGNPGTMAFSSELRKSIDGSFNAGTLEQVRLRLNHNLTNLSRWTMAEYRWNGASSALRLESLADEFGVSCNAANIVPACDNFFQVWKQLDTSPAQQASPLAGELLGKVKNYNADAETGLWIPKALARGTGHARNVFGLQRCTGCHGAETGTDFMHIANRASGTTTAKLSGFLTGKKIDPSWEELSVEPAKNKVVGKVTVKFDDFNADKKGSVQRAFHDLGRRRAHLASVAVLSDPPAPKQIEAIHKYAPDFAH